jgi:hypothetical protein
VHTQLNADESARFLAAKVRRREPFAYVRYGDGALECMAGLRGRTCDGEDYAPGLASELAYAWYLLHGAENVWLGDWLSASFDSSTEHSRYEQQFSELARGHDKWLHCEALLLMRESGALVDFYRAAKEDRRRKMFLGPAANRRAADLLGARFMEVPLQDLYQYADLIERQLLQADFEVLLWGAGLASIAPVVNCWRRRPQCTYVHLGSAMDPLFRGRTRRQQIDQDRAWAVFAEFFDETVCQSA